MRTRSIRLKVAVASATVALAASLGSLTPVAHADPLPPSPHDPALPGMRPTHLQISGDLDRDGRADVVATKTTLDGALVQGRRGHDGALLWERVLPGTTDMGVVPIAALTGAFYRFGSTTTSVLPAQVDGGDGVVVAQYVRTGFLYVTVGAAAANNLELRLTGIRGDGSLAWVHNSSTVPAALAHTGGVGAGVGGFFSPSFHGLADLVGGPADDAMVVLEYSPTEYTANDVWHWEAIIVDGDTGRVASQQRIVTKQGASLDMFAAGDVNGDGGPDYALLVGGVNRVRVHRADGKTIWVRDINLSYEPRLVAAGDTDGDGRGDLLLDGQTVLSGADGRTLFERRHDTMSPRGDVDGDGRAEVGVVGTRATPSVRHEALDGTGEGTFVSEFPIASSLRYSRFTLRVDIGDADADGVADASHDVRWTGGVEQGVVSGATGTKLWSGPVEGSDPSAERLVVLRAAIDGSGADLLRVRRAADDSLWADAVDGAAGMALWSTDLRTTEESLASPVASAGDVDGDGRADVVINVNRRDCRYVWVGFGWRSGDGEACDYDMFVLSGADGSVLWTP